MDSLTKLFVGVHHTSQARTQDGGKSPAPPPPLLPPKWVCTAFSHSLLLPLECIVLQDSLPYSRIFWGISQAPQRPRHLILEQFPVNPKKKKKPPTWIPAYDHASHALIRLVTVILLIESKFQDKGLEAPCRENNPPPLMHFAEPAIRPSTIRTEDPTCANHKDVLTVRSVFPSNVHINNLRGFPCRLECLRLKLTNEPSILWMGIWLSR